MLQPGFVAGFLIEGNHVVVGGAYEDETLADGQSAVLLA
jgi:hypothetical protein